MARIIVKNLPKNITEEKLRDIFGQKGSITDVQLKYTPDGKFKQFALIGYQNDNEAEDAIKAFNNTRINTTKITVETCALLEHEVLKHLKEEEEFASHIPAILPQYCEILNQDSSYVVKLQDLDLLQENLETLLVRSAKTERLLRAYIEDKKENKRRTVKVKKGARRSRTTGTVRRNTLPKRTPPRSPENQLQKALLLTNQISKKFWEYVATYCRDVTEKDIEFLELLHQQSLELVDKEVPEKGEHYTMPWDVDTIINVNVFRRKPTRTPRITDRKSANKKKKEVLVKLRTLRSIFSFKNGLCLDNRYEHCTKDDEEDDFVLQEIKKCHDELESVRQNNIEALKKLREDAKIQMNLLNMESNMLANDIKEEN